MNTLEDVKNASINEILRFAEDHDSVSSLLSKEERGQYSEAEKTLERLNGKVIQITEAMIARVSEARNESDYDGTFEEEHGYDEDDAGDIMSDFGGSIASDLGMDFDGRELWESSSC